MRRCHLPSSSKVACPSPLLMDIPPQHRLVTMPLLLPGIMLTWLRRGSTRARLGIVRSAPLQKLLVCWAWVARLLLLLVLVPPFRPQLVLVTTRHRRHLEEYCRGLAELNRWPWVEATVAVVDLDHRLQLATISAEEEV